MALPNSSRDPERASRAVHRVAIIQSGYLPWRGYFDIIHDVDSFVFLDDVQFTVRDWRNRNRIKTPGGVVWLTVPTGNRRDVAIDEVRLPDAAWQRRHWETLRHVYGHAPHFARYREYFEWVYRGCQWEGLSELNQSLIRMISTQFLGCSTAFRDARILQAQGSKTSRLLELLLKLGATHYVTGPSTRAYLDVPLLENNGIHVRFKDYSGYPDYPQGRPPFHPQLSVVDLLFHAGPDSARYIWGWRPPEGS